MLGRGPHRWCALVLGAIATPGVASAQSESSSSAPPSSAPEPSPAPSAVTTELSSPPPEGTTSRPPPPPSSIPSYADGSHPVNSQQRPQEEDNGRNIDFLFIQGEFGYSYVNLTGLSSHGTLIPALSQTQGSGYGGGATIGFRSWIFAIAAHGYVSHFDAGCMPPMGASANPCMSTSEGFDLGQVMLEGQLRIPLPVIEPYIRIDVGYAWLGNFQYNSMYAMSTSNIDGYTGGIGAGLDVWLGKYITIGAGVDFTAMNVRRGGVQRSGSACAMNDLTCVELSQDGDAAGTLIHAHLQAGLHF